MTDLETLALELPSPHPDLPTLGDAAFRSYAYLLQDGEEAPPQVREAAQRWLDTQYELWEEAQHLVDTLEALSPTPSSEEVVAGTAVFPAWYAKDWWLVLRSQPLAENLGLAIESARGLVARIHDAE